MNNSFRTSGKSGHIRTFSSRLYGRKSLEKGSYDRKKSAVRTQPGHFASGQVHGKLGVRAPLKLYREAHDRAHHGAHDRRMTDKKNICVANRDLPNQRYKQTTNDE